MRATIRTVFIATLAALTLTSTDTLQAQEPETSVEELRKQTREDIQAGYELFAKHHPGMYNPLDPTFGERLKTARDEALAKADTVTNAVERFLASRVINRSLADGHARLAFGLNGETYAWPGFRAVWRGDALYVTLSDHATPKRGDKLLSCDGRPANDLIREEVFTAWGHPEEAGHWWIWGEMFFERRNTSVIPQPEVCRFQSPDGNFKDVELEWVPFPQDRRGEFNTWSKRPLVGMKRLDNGLRWITLSSFNPDPDGIAAYEEIFETLDGLGDALSNDRAIVLDLRHNGGGSSSWSRKIAERLWGEKAVEWAMADYFRKTEVWYLADQANIDHFKGGAQRFRDKGIEDVAEILDEIHSDLSDAKAKGQTFFKSPFGAELLAEAEPAEPRTLPPVYVITHGFCASACLDGIDTFTRFDGVKLVGAPTSADTEYLEIRFQDLPTGRGAVILPTKIWINRPRASGEVYHPDILVTDLDWDTEAMERAILADLEAERTALAP
ncbi:MAG: S41 family peptidase [Pseudomonadota bacterium]